VIQAILVQEHVTSVAPLGVCFWDALTARRISDGLVVTVFPVDQPWRTWSAFPNHQDVFVVRNVPGLRAVENGSGDADFWNSQLPHRCLVLQVDDLRGRFLPFVFHVDAPQRGLAKLDCAGSPLELAGSPLEPVAHVPLFSAPGRLAPGGAAIVRADLWDPDANAGRGAPAAWATLEISAPGQAPVIGVTDQQGHLAIFFPYPEPARVPLATRSGSPLDPQQAGPSLSKQTWRLSLRAAYTPISATPVRPHLTDVLEQHPATVWADGARTVPLQNAELQFGRELVLSSQGSTPPSVLLIRAGYPL